jgi:glycosyltransferase involved in cell wall biosynthesis
MNNPLVSIVICCHNRAALLPQTMVSVFAQKYKPVEIVVIDDGSTDNTRDLMASYGGRIRYYWQENQGIASARTIGCRLARGELIAFQDDDDLMPPDRIVHLCEGLRQYPSAVFATGDYAFIDPEGNLTGKRWLPGNLEDREKPVLIDDAYMAVLWPKVPAVPHTTLFRKCDGKRIGWFDTQFKNASEDKDFFARLGQLGTIVYIPEIVSYYRQGHGSLTNNSILVAYSQFLLFEKHLKSLTPSQEKLRNRLQHRLLSSLIKISSCRSQGMRLPHSASKDFLKRGIRLIGPRGRLAYWWHTLIKLPIRRVIRGISS